MFLLQFSVYEWLIDYFIMFFFSIWIIFASIDKYFFLSSIKQRNETIIEMFESFCYINCLYNNLNERSFHKWCLNEQIVWNEIVNEMKVADSIFQRHHIIKIIKSTKFRSLTKTIIIIFSIILSWNGGGFLMINCLPSWTVVQSKAFSKLSGSP